MTRCESRLNYCVFAGNEGTAFNNFEGDPILTNCTATGNSGEGVNTYRGDVKLSNCILWGNSGQEIETTDGMAIVSYSDVQGGWGGTGNINNDPLFADATNGDYRLKSQIGRWDPVGEVWVEDPVTSPCIDAGDPASDWPGEFWPHGKRINMGAYGGTAQASMSESTVGSAADCNNDDAVDGTDLLMLAGRWLDEGLLMPEDLDRNGIVDFYDYVEMAGGCSLK